MDITILICTHNSSKRIIQTLEHIINQKISNEIQWELIVVDYESSDDTINVIKSIWPQSLAPLIIINESKPGKTPALESGLANSNGNYICIVDDDNWIFNDYIDIAFKVMTINPEVGIIGALGFAECEIDPPAWFQDYTDTFAVGHQSIKSGLLTTEDRAWFWGAGSVIRKSAWLKTIENGFIPFFNPSRNSEEANFKKGFIGGEDTELCFAIQLTGFKLWYEPNLKYKHYIPKNRLQLNYLNDATIGTSNAQPILRIYLSVLTSNNTKGIVRKIIYQNWYFHIAYLLFRYLTESIKSFNFINKLKRVQIQKQYYAQLTTMFFIKNNFNSYVFKIKNLKNSN